MAESIIENTPYQKTRDSPTIKYYTDWRLFEEKRRLPYEEESTAPSWADASYHAVLSGSRVALNEHGEILMEEIAPGIGTRGSWFKPLTLLQADSRMAVVHAYRWRAGIAIMVPPARIIRNPVYVLSVGGGRGYAGHHIMLYVGRGSHISVEIHDAAPEDAAGLKTLVVEAVLEPSAYLSLKTFSKASPGSLLYHRKIVSVGAGSKADSRSIVVGGGFTHYREDYELRDTKAEVSADYRLASSGTCRLDAISNALHLGPDTRSAIKARGAVMDQGYLTHRGVARVSGKAEGSETSIDSLVLLLSREAEANSIPMLEIETSRVASARHAASVASLDEDHLFYMASRGLGREEAMRLLLRDLLRTEGSGPRLTWECV